MVILEEAGGKMSRWDGSPLDPFDSRKDVLVTNGLLHDACLKLLERA
jgi:fructose-1,6-bisphosphatase/inositol monophosphatase family enzyme